MNKNKKDFGVKVSREDENNGYYSRVKIENTNPDNLFVDTCSGIHDVLN